MRLLNLYRETLKFLLSLCLVSVISACGSEESTQELMTLEMVKMNIIEQDLTISQIDIPDQIKSTEAMNQSGYEINNSGDKVYIYEYSNNETLESDNITIYNNLNGIHLPNSPLIMTSHNVLVLYIKQDSNEYEIENKILTVL